MKTATAKASWLDETGVRLDASYHLSEGRQAQITIESQADFDSLADVTERIFLGGRFRRTYVEDPVRGYPYMTASDMIKASPVSGVYLSKIHTGKTDKLKIEKNWILISCSGSIGRTVYTNADFEGQLGTHDLIRVVPDPAKMPGGYVYAFLSSKYGFALLTQGTYGGVIQHIEPHHIAGLPVPRLPSAQMQQIHVDIEKAARLREEATRLLAEADEVFHEGNDLQYPDSWLAPSENADKIYNRVRASQFFEVSIKARNHSYRSSRIVETWESKPGVILEDYLAKPFTNGTGGHFKRIDDANFKGAGMVSQSDLHRQNPSNYKPVKIIRASKNDYAQPEMVLFPSVGNGVGENEIFVQPTLAYKVYEGELLSGDIGRLVCHSVEDAAYLFTALRSKAGFRILRAFIYGTTLRRVNWQLIKGLNIPVASPALKSKISRLVMTAFEHRHEANQLETQAIYEVETAISAWQK